MGSGYRRGEVDAAWGVETADGRIWSLPEERGIAGVGTSCRGESRGAGCDQLSCRSVLISGLGLNLRGLCPHGVHRRERRPRIGHVVVTARQLSETHSATESCGRRQSLRARRRCLKRLLYFATCRCICLVCGEATQVLELSQSVYATGFEAGGRQRDELHCALDLSRSLTEADSAADSSTSSTWKPSSPEAMCGRSSAIAPTMFKPQARGRLRPPRDRAVFVGVSLR